MQCKNQTSKCPPASGTAGRENVVDPATAGTIQNLFLTESAPDRLRGSGIQKRIQEGFRKYCFNTSLKSTNASKLGLALFSDSKRTRPEEVDWFLELEEIGNIFAASILGGGIRLVTHFNLITLR